MFLGIFILTTFVLSALFFFIPAASLVTYSGGLLGDSTNLALDRALDIMVAVVGGFVVAIIVNAISEEPLSYGEGVKTAYARGPATKKGW